jgi:hypothetical protein
MAQSEQPIHEDHPHQHAPDCGHASAQHGDHVDYFHDGHVHVSDEGRWRECENAAHAAHENHDHEHQADCGHEAVRHGDHVDYVHDGHRHAAHEDHWDEH